jgi:hypothetical protein
MSFVRLASIALVGLVLSATWGCGGNGGGGGTTATPEQSQAAADASAAIDKQAQQTDPLLKGSAKKK